MHRLQNMLKFRVLAYREATTEMISQNEYLCKHCFRKMCPYRLLCDDILKLKLFLSKVLKMIDERFWTLLTFTHLIDLHEI